MQFQWNIAGGLCCVSLFILYIQEVSSIGCFVCSSVNGSEPDCEDTFNNTGKFYMPECKAGRKGRAGIFPATECVKLIAKKETGFSMVVRACVVDNGDINSETEIGRESHCWLVNKVMFNDETMEGCSLACNTNGCNDSTSNLTLSFKDRLRYLLALALLAALSALV